MQQVASEPPPIPRDATPALSEAEVKKLRGLVATTGLAPIARQIPVGREALARLLAGAETRLGTVVLARQFLRGGERA